MLRGGYTNLPPLSSTMMLNSDGDGRHLQQFARNCSFWNCIMGTPMTAVQHSLVHACGRKLHALTPPSWDLILLRTLTSWTLSSCPAALLLPYHAQQHHVAHAGLCIVWAPVALLLVSPVPPDDLAQDPALPVHLLTPAASKLTSIFSPPASHPSSSLQAVLPLTQVVRQSWVMQIGAKMCSWMTDSSSYGCCQLDDSLHYCCCPLPLFSCTALDYIRKRSRLSVDCMPA